MTKPVDMRSLLVEGPKPSPPVDAKRPPQRRKPRREPPPLPEESIEFELVIEPPKPPPPPPPRARRSSQQEPGPVASPRVGNGLVVALIAVSVSVAAWSQSDSQANAHPTPPVASVNVETPGAFEERARLEPPAPEAVPVVAEESIEEVILIEEEEALPAARRSDRRRQRQRRQRRRRQARDLLGLASDVHNAGQRDEAIELYQEALELRPSLAEAAAGLSVAHFDLGEFDKAVTYGKQAVASDPGNPEYRVLLGDACFRSARPADARDQWATATRLGSARGERRLAKLDG